MRFFAFISFCIAAFCLLVPAAMIKLPPEFFPWTPLDLKAESNLLTGYKLSRLSRDPLACHEALTASGIKFRPLPDRKAGTCELKNIVALKDTKYSYSSPINATCPAAAALIFWEHHVLQPAALEHLNSDIAGIEQLGIFACRNVRASSSRLSQHASANAIDISAFRLKNGKTISLSRDWGKDTSAGEFLQKIRDGSCSVFRAVLGPDYNALHKDHFHFDMGRYKICR